MKEFERVFDSVLAKGLRRFPSPRNSDGLLECHNWAPMEAGLKPHEEITLIGSEESFYLLQQNLDYILQQNGDKIII